uniref:Uncharacterized protein n=1 Tax=Eutreptiella gymnastica TaxID=73025 RepID=A0A7S4L9V2_9EUGL
MAPPAAKVGGDDPMQVTFDPVDEAFRSVETRIRRVQQSLNATPIQSTRSQSSSLHMMGSSRDSRSRSPQPSIAQYSEQGTSVYGSGSMRGAGHSHADQREWEEERECTFTPAISELARERYANRDPNETFTKLHFDAQYISAKQQVARREQQPTYSHKPQIHKNPQYSYTRSSNESVFNRLSKTPPRSAGQSSPAKSACPAKSRQSKIATVQKPTPSSTVKSVTPMYGQQAQTSNSKATVASQHPRSSGGAGPKGSSPTKSMGSSPAKSTVTRAPTVTRTRKVPTTKLSTSKTTVQKKTLGGTKTSNPSKGKASQPENTVTVTVTSPEESSDADQAAPKPPIDPFEFALLNDFPPAADADGPPNTSFQSNPWLEGDSDGDTDFGLASGRTTPIARPACIPVLDFARI